MNCVVIIPARMASTRLPGKPLADIAGVPMIVRVWTCAVAAKIGPVAVAAGDEEIAACVRSAGGSAVLTDPGLASGTDRVFAALADGGHVQMPLNKTFWSPRFGMVTDRFGLGWMVTVMP